MSQVNLYYAGTPGDGYGWGVCNRELKKALKEVFGIRRIVEWPQLANWVFMPLADHDFNPITDERAKRNAAFTFFESELGPNAAANAAKYDVVFCGSTWCLERMRERGITNGRVLIQGVDHEIFKPMPVARTDNEFRIFSGGKFEYRKGQDIVIAAFRELAKKYDNMRLVCAWHNPWPGLISGMWQSQHLSPFAKMHAVDFHSPMNQEEFFRWFLEANGVDPERAEIHGQLSQPDLAAVMNQTDLGVFPNRCEGGTNLVLMEYMACGKPVVATWATGHADIIDDLVIPDWPLIDFAIGTGGDWAESDVSGVIEVIEEVYSHREFAAKMGSRGMAHIQQFTWERAARTVLDAVLEFQ